MSTILEKCNQIKYEKDAEILPQNIRTGVQIFDIRGEYEGLDTSNATATPSDILSGKTAYVNGEMITGDIASYAGIDVDAISASYWDNEQIFYAYGNFGSTAMFEGGGMLGLRCPFSLIANTAGLYPWDLRAGVTCLGVTGTLEEGINTSDATATANDIAEGRTAYVNGERIEGTVSTVHNDMAMEASDVIYVNDVLDGKGGEPIIVNYFSAYANLNNTLFRDGSSLNLSFSPNKIAELINLSPEQIVSGNTILGVDGTAQAGNSENGILQFSSKEELDNYIPDNPDTLALVYQLGDLRNVTKGDTFKILYFPDEVVTPTPYPHRNQCHWNLPHVGGDDNWSTPHGSVSYIESLFTFTAYHYSELEEDGIGVIKIVYKSSDQQTYRLDRDACQFTERCYGNVVVLPQEFLCPETGQTWGDEISLFLRAMELPNNVLDFGLYRYSAISGCWVPMPTMSEATPENADAGTIFGSITGLQKGLRGNLELSDSVNALYAELSLNNDRPDITYTASTSTYGDLSFKQLASCLEVFDRYQDTNMTITITGGEEWDLRYIVLEYADGVASLRFNYTYDESCVKVYFHRPMNKATDFPLYKWLTVDDSGNWTTGINEDTYMELEMTLDRFNPCTKEVIGYVESENDEVLRALCYLANKYMKLSLSR